MLNRRVVRFETPDFKHAAMRVVGTLLAQAMKAWMRTLDSRIACYDPWNDPVVAGFREPSIYIIWHEYLALPPTNRRGCDVTMLLSQHRDAEWLTEIIDNFGFRTVRGSSTRGGVKALLQIVRQCRGSSVVITPDGPRGPRRELTTGCIYLAGLTGMPIVPLGCGFDRPWRNKSWDRFAVPRPSSRARLVLGPSITIPRKLDDAGLERYRVYLQQMLEAVTLESETWAADGVPRYGERAFYPAPAGSVVV